MSYNCHIFTIPKHTDEIQRTQKICNELLQNDPYFVPDDLFELLDAKEFAYAGSDTVTDWAESLDPSKQFLNGLLEEWMDEVVYEVDAQDIRHLIEFLCAQQVQIYQEREELIADVLAQKRPIEVLQHDLYILLQTFRAKRVSWEISQDLLRSNKENALIPYAVDISLEHLIDQLCDLIDHFDPNKERILICCW